MLFNIILAIPTCSHREGELLGVVGASSESVAGRWPQSAKTRVASLPANRVLIGLKLPHFWQIKLSKDKICHTPGKQNSSRKRVASLMANKALLGQELPHSQQREFWWDKSCHTPSNNNNKKLCKDKSCLTPKKLNSGTTRVASLLAKRVQVGQKLLNSRQTQFW